MSEPFIVDNRNLFRVEWIGSVIPQGMTIGGTPVRDACNEELYAEPYDYRHPVAGIAQYKRVAFAKGDTPHTMLVSTTAEQVTAPDNGTVTPVRKSELFYDNALSMDHTSRSGKASETSGEGKITRILNNTDCHMRRY